MHCHDKIMTVVKNLLEKLFTEMSMPESHGLNHCLTVLDHMNTCIRTANKKLEKLLTAEKVLSLRLAALLHEADDHKYFPSSEKFDNARNICEEAIPNDLAGKESLISDVVLMISLVSASVNGNSVPEAARVDPTLLWPRYCDRLESIGVIGAVRCFQYNTENGDPLMLDTTPRPRSDSEVWAEVREERWTRYQSGVGSSSMMDHYYDKLLHVGKIEPEVVQCDYLVSEASRRVQPLVDICVEAGLSGEAPVESLKKLEKSLKQN